MEQLGVVKCSKWDCWICNSHHSFRHSIVFWIRTQNKSSLVPPWSIQLCAETGNIKDISMLLSTITGCITLLKAIGWINYKLTAEIINAHSECKFPFFLLWRCVVIGISMWVLHLIWFMVLFFFFINYCGLFPELTEICCNPTFMDMQFC